MARRRARSHSEQQVVGRTDRHTPSTSAALRLVVGLGDAERERDLIPALVGSVRFLWCSGAYSADQVLDCIRREQVDVVLLAEGLHRLTWSIVSDLGRSRTPFVLLTSNPNEPRLRNAAGVILSSDDDPSKVQQAILAAIRGERTVAPHRRHPGSAEPASPALKRLHHHWP